MILRVFKIPVLRSPALFARFTRPAGFNAVKNIFIFYIQGEGFLKQMIRNLVGTQLALLAKKTNFNQSGKEKDMQRYEQILNNWRAIFLAKDRKMALKTAPADGLYLYKVYYPSELDRKCQEI